MSILINVTNKRAVVVGAPVIVCGNSDYSVAFTFDSEWEGMTAKTARFVYVQDGEVAFQDVPFTGDTVDVPILTNTNAVRVGVYAGDLCTTTPATIPCERSIRCGTGEPVDPTPSQYDRIMELIGSGGLKGDQGEKGEKGEKGDRGEKGEKGDRGEPGHTPQRGVDYWTEEDVEDIHEYAGDILTNARFLLLKRTTPRVASNADGQNVVGPGWIDFDNSAPIEQNKETMLRFSLKLESTIPTTTFGNQLIVKLRNYSGGVEKSVTCAARFRGDIGTHAINLPLSMFSGAEDAWTNIQQMNTYCYANTSAAAGTYTMTVSDLQIIKTEGHESGTFTMTCDANGADTISCQYEKVGKTVTVHGVAGGFANTWSAGLAFSGLPYAAASNAPCVWASPASGCFVGFAYVTGKKLRIIPTIAWSPYEGQNTNVSGLYTYAEFTVTYICP